MDNVVHAPRCAIYTRKSHEEGLDQDFNSLDAQFESCRSYIASQAGLGWIWREARYDDGGISGGHMERPGLQALLSDVEAGLIDIIVVYKVDRLTRSLTDFAKLMDAFDTNKVSFVSVTQAFNTTTSMGRLTLNVLLSFAQFEREVTAERIRDKITASKKKGMWMGGKVPLGYRTENKTLKIEPEEAETIRQVFQIYAEAGTVPDTKRELDALGLITKLRVDRYGKQTGGQSFTRGHIYTLLRNPIYVGKIRHKAKVHDGLHEPIIEVDLWDTVQSLLDGNAPDRRSSRNTKSKALFASLLVDESGDPLVPHHARKAGKRYRYYVSRKTKTGEQRGGWRLPAQMLEREVMLAIINSLSNESAIVKMMSGSTLDAGMILKVTSMGGEVADSIRASTRSEKREHLVQLIEQIRLTKDTIAITFSPEGLADALGCDPSDLTEPTIISQITLRRRGHELKLVLGGVERKVSNPDPTLIRLVATAYKLRTELEDGKVGSIKAFAETHGLDHADAKRMLPLGYLDPMVVETILDGRQSPELTSAAIRSGYDLPVLFTEQRAQLGL